MNKELRRILMRQKETRRILMREKRNALKKLKEVQREKKKISKEMFRLKDWIDTTQFLGPEQFDKIFSETSHEEIMENKNMKLGKFDGVYIVTKRNEPAVLMTKFYDFIRDVNPPVTMEIADILNLPCVGSDGKTVSFAIGALVYVKKKLVTTKQGTGTGFHFANVGPGAEEVVVQYEYALSKLGLAVAPEIDKHILNYEGQFRQILSDLAEGKRSA